VKKWQGNSDAGKKNLGEERKRDDFSCGQRKSGAEKQGAPLWEKRDRYQKSWRTSYGRRWTGETASKKSRNRGRGQEKGRKETHEFMERIIQAPGKTTNKQGGKEISGCLGVLPKSTGGEKRPGSKRTDEKEFGEEKALFWENRTKK